VPNLLKSGNVPGFVRRELICFSKVGLARINSAVLADKVSDFWVTLAASIQSSKGIKLS